MVPTFYEPEKQPLKELEGSPNEKELVVTLQQLVVLIW